MGTVIHFEITTDAPRATSEFLAAAFGWTAAPAAHYDEYQMLETGTGPGIDGGITTRTYQYQPVTLWILVPDLQATMDAVLAAGGSVMGAPTEIPGEGLFVRVSDPFGTLFGLKQETPPPAGAFGLPLGG